MIEKSVMERENEELEYRAIAGLSQALIDITAFDQARIWLDKLKEKTGGTYFVADDGPEMVSSYVGLLVDANSKESDIFNELSLQEIRGRWTGHNLMLDKVVALRHRDMVLLRELSDCFEARKEVLSEKDLEKRGIIEERKKIAEQGLSQAYFSLGEQALGYSLTLGVNALSSLTANFNDEGDQNKKNLYKGALLFVNTAVPFLYNTIENELEVGPMERVGQKPYSHAAQAANVLMANRALEFFVSAFQDRSRRLYLRNMGDLPSLMFASDGSHLNMSDACCTLAHDFPGQYQKVRDHVEKVLGEPPVSSERMQQFNAYYQNL